MKKVLVVIAALSLFVSAQSTKHVFWYRCVQNNYNLATFNAADSSGPNIQGEVVKHQGKQLTATVRLSAGNHEAGYNLGNYNSAGFSNVIWFADLCSLKLSTGATLTSAKFRGEYRDAYSGNPFNTGGAINARVGVVSIANHLSYLDVLPHQHPDNGTWADADNPVTATMGFSAPGGSFQAQESKAITTKEGNNGITTQIEGQFFEMDITTQVNYILSDPATSGNIRQLGIASIVPTASLGTGKVNLYAFENFQASMATADPWTTDYNTGHLLLEVANGTLEYKDGMIAVEDGVTAESDDASITSNPNPCNPVTVISYNTGAAKSGVVKIFNAEGKLVNTTKVSGKGSFSWNGKALNSGIYFCRLEAGKSVASHNLILMK